MLYLHLFSPFTYRALSNYFVDLNFVMDVHVCTENVLVSVFNLHDLEIMSIFLVKGALSSMDLMRKNLKDKINHHRNGNLFTCVWDIIDISTRLLKWIPSYQGKLNRK